MESIINKKNVIAVMENETVAPETRAEATNLICLIEIKEAVEKGFATLEQSQGAGLMLAVEYKETLDSFLQHRLKSEELLTKMIEEFGRLQSETAEMDEVVRTLGDRSVSGKNPEYDDKPESPPDEQKKSSVTQTEGSSGRIPSGSGKT